MRALVPKADTSTSTRAVPQDDTPASCLEVVNQKGTVSEYSVTIIGSAKNTCGRNFRYVEINFKVFEGSRAVVGKATDNLSGLDGGETWEFRAVALSPGKRCRLDEIKGF
jgi:hypothetical protein